MKTNSTETDSYIYDETLHFASIDMYKIKDSGTIVLDHLSGNQVFTVGINPNQKFVSYNDAGSVVSYMLNGIKYQVAPNVRSINQ